MTEQPNRIQIGCGLNTPEDWINIDGSWNAWLAKYPGLRSFLKSLHVFPASTLDVPWSPDIFIHDVRKPLPFRDNSIGAIYSSHLLEHLYLEEAQQLLQECFRIMQPSGILRIVVPDSHNQMEPLRQDRGWERDVPIPDPHAPSKNVWERLSKAFDSSDQSSHNFVYKIYNNLQVFHVHKVLYDAASLSRSFQQVGFVDVHSMRAHQSQIEGIEKIENVERVEMGSICIEGIKPNTTE